MQTVNISLPTKLASRLDEVVDNEGYASRSEFVRSLVRFYLATTQRPELVLKPFKKIPLNQLEKEMKATGKYNEKFIKSVIGGLSESPIYADN